MQIRWWEQYMSNRYVVGLGICWNWGIVLSESLKAQRTLKNTEKRGLAEVYTCMHVYTSWSIPNGTLPDGDEWHKLTVCATKRTCRGLSDARIRRTARILGLVPFEL